MVRRPMLSRGDRVLTGIVVGLAMLAGGGLSETEAQKVADANYDESKVPRYSLVDPTEGFDVTTWRTEGRAKWLDIFRREMFGFAPKPPASTAYETISDELALEGKARRKIVRIELMPDSPGENAQPVRIDVLMYLPPDAKTPVGMFVGLNFKGNHTVSSDPGIPLGTTWTRGSGGRPGEPVQAQESERGESSRRWPIDLIVERGYGLATAYYGDIDPDFDDGFQNGVHGPFDPSSASDPSVENPVHPGRAKDAWGSIAGWAWGLSRIADYLITDDGVDPRRLMVMGHSRLGKTSLWAGANDERFALVISNNSGCGGAALSKRVVGESVHRINTSFPHWFCDNFKAYNAAEEKLPFDQHVLIGLMAPRPVFISSAEEDRWADPKGEFLAAQAAAPIYATAGVRDAFPAQSWPGVGETVSGTIGYRLRDGVHDVRRDDWEAWIDFADKHFGQPDAAQ